MRTAFLGRGMRQDHVDALNWLHGHLEAMRGFGYYVDVGLFEAGPPKEGMGPHYNVRIDSAQKVIQRMLREAKEDEERQAKRGS